MTIIEQQVEDFRAALVKFDIDDTDSLCLDYKNMLERQKSPSEYWRLLDRGSFKECYTAPTSDKIVIKFAINCHNIINDEKELLLVARERGMEDFFPKTVYLPLDIRIPEGALKDYTKDGCLDYIIIQEKVTTIQDYKSIWDSYAPDRLFDSNGKYMPLYELKDCYINSLTWCTLAIQYYGVEYFRKLRSFIIQEEIDDIGYNNVGLLPSNNQPVIFDWIYAGNVYHH